MMKQLRKAAEAAQSAKLHRMGAMGSMKAAHKAETAPRKYASGGSVEMPIDGKAAKPNLSRPGRKAPGKGKPKGTNVNVVIMQKPDGAMPPKAPADMPMPPPAAAGPMPMPPPGPGPGGPPPMMRKTGGSVKAYKTGGKVKCADGGEVMEHDDKAADEALIKKMIRPGALKK